MSIDLSIWASLPWPAQVRLLLVGGSPDTGKTTLAGAVADRVGGVLLSSDRVRKETFGLDPAQRHATHYRRGIYTQEATKQTYWHLAERAGSALTMGECVVVDASFSTTARSSPPRHGRPEPGAAGGGSVRRS
jgi:predicted kinase